MKSNAESYQSMNMGPRNLLILFFSAVAVSLVILIILSSLVFKNLSLDFNTHLPESTPDIGHQFTGGTSSMNPDSKADNVTRATLNVPPESVEPAAGPGSKDKAEPSPDTAPVSDDSVLENNAPLPLGDTLGGPQDAEQPPVAPVVKNTGSAASKAAPVPAHPSRPGVDRGMDPNAARTSTPELSPSPAPDAVDSENGSSSAPPVPGQ